ncbi:hypothetical protein DPEC_G00193790 [Dallia pectoralis]|uniref:Uncharacterized protein n=1 Tax=Dallia pectoralis TaxID=75939 RepID=A0ACC2G6W2_DALPE|nr:hypothetical protein DPEC_G00193790 [Dallia pectoralis]
MDTSGFLLQHYCAYSSPQYQWPCPGTSSDSEVYSASSPDTVSPHTSMGDCLSPSGPEPWDSTKRVRTSNSDVREPPRSTAGHGRRCARRRVRSQQRESASEKEKLRMRDLTKALHHLRTYLPPSVAPVGQTLTKIEILRLTIGYISSLSNQLELPERDGDNSTHHTEPDILGFFQCSSDIGHLSQLGQRQRHGHYPMENQNPNSATTDGSEDWSGVSSCEAHQTALINTTTEPFQRASQTTYSAQTLQLYGKNFCSQLLPGSKVRVSSVMKLKPQQAPLYGQVVITVQLCDEERDEDEDGDEYFLLFSGSSQSHLTSAQRSGHDTLQAMCPAHDCSEVVPVSLGRARPGNLPSVLTVSEQRFRFVQDLAFDMAQFLVSTAGRPDGLEGALLLDDCQIPLEECERLDESLSLALRHLELPEGWSLLGSHLTNSTELRPQETLLHFAARRGLEKVTAWLLLQPGAPEALRLTNRQGLTPAAYAHLRGHQHLHQLLIQAEEDGKAQARTFQLSPDLRVTSHLPRLNTYTLTVETTPGRDPHTLQRLVKDLTHLVKEHPSLVQLQAEPVHGRIAPAGSDQSEGGGGAEQWACSEENFKVLSDRGPCHAPQPSDTGSVESWVCPVTLYSPSGYSRTEREDGEERKEESAGETSGVSREGHLSWHEQGGSWLICRTEDTGTEGGTSSETQLVTDGTGKHIQDVGNEKGQEENACALSGHVETSTVGATGCSQSLERLATLDYHPDIHLTVCLLGEDREVDSCQDGSISLVRVLSDQEKHEGPDAEIESVHEGDTPVEQSQETAAASRKDSEGSTEEQFLPTEAGCQQDEGTGLHSGDQADKAVGQYNMDSTGDPQSPVTSFYPGEEGEEPTERPLNQRSGHARDITAEEAFCHSRPDEVSEHLDNQPATDRALYPPGMLTFDPPVTRSDCGADDITSVEVSIVPGDGPANSPSGTAWEEGTSVPDVLHYHPIKDPVAADVMVVHQGDALSPTIHSETEAVRPGPCPLTDRQIRHTDVAPDNRDSEAVFTEFQSISSRLTFQRAPGSDSESVFSPGEDSVFSKGDGFHGDDTVTEGSTSELSLSCSSADDTASGAPTSSSPESRSTRGQRRRCPGCVVQIIRGQGGGVKTKEEAEEEAKDRRTEVPQGSAEHGPSVRPPSPFRRHSWGPGKDPGGEEDMNKRSYSLEGLSEVRDDGKGSSAPGAITRKTGQRGAFRHHGREEKGGSLLSLTEELEADMEVHIAEHGQKSRRCRPLRNSCPSMNLSKSVSMLNINQRDVDSMRTFSSTSGSLAHSISEENTARSLTADRERKSGTKVSKTFSYLKNKMYKKTREKDREKSRDKEERKEAKDRDKRMLNGHHFHPVSSQTQSSSCHQCSKPINTKEAFLCTNCNAHVHKGCRESVPACVMEQMKVAKQQFVPDTAVIPVVTLRTKRESKPASRERPWSAILLPEDSNLLSLPQRRHTSIMPFQSSNLSKSISISNIAGHQVFDDMPIKGLRCLSQSTDSLCKTSLGSASTDSLMDEGPEMIDSQLMGEFEADVKELTADSWSNIMDNNFLKHLQKDVVKRQDVIYELIQTEMHHVRILRIMAEVYSKGLQRDLLLEPHALGRLFPVLDDLLDLHTSLLARLLERKRESQREREGGGFVINKIGDILQTQFSGFRAELMKRAYGKFCSRHNEAVNYYKELNSRDKRFQVFIRKKMSSSIVRRLSIPECILLVTQRITKYPVLMQRILQHTTETEEEHEDLSDALCQVKEVIAAVDNKVNEKERKRRLKDIYSRTDSKSIMRMKSGQMFAREDLLRGGRLVHDGPLQLKNAQGRLKDVTAMLLSDVFVFLQEKDQKYVFAPLDQRSTVLSLQKLIVREVANEERGLFLITAGIEKPEMVEVHAATKEERNMWMQLIQDAMQSISTCTETHGEKEDDEEFPSETEDRLLEAKAKEMREMLRRKDDQILSLLEEKMTMFREMCEFGCPDKPLDTGPGEGPDHSPSQRTRRKLLFRVGSGGSSEDIPKGEPIMKDALLEVETLQALVDGGLTGADGGRPDEPGGEGIDPGPVCLPRRAETFGGFDSHQIHIYKNGAKVEPEDTADLRRTESDGILKKGGNANLLLLRKRNSPVLQSVTHLHDLLSSLQAVVIQQDSLIEDQRQALTVRPERLATSTLRPNSLVEQEKQRSREKHRQEMTTLQRQLAAYDQEKRRRENEWEVRDRQLTDREVQVLMLVEEMRRRRRKLDAERQELQERREDYQKNLERLKEAQRKLDRDRELVQQERKWMETMRLTDRQMERSSSSTSDDCLNRLDRHPEYPTDRSSFPRRGSLPRATEITFSPPALKAPRGEHQNQIPSRLLQLARDRGREKKDKTYRDKKDKTGQKDVLSPDTNHLEAPIEGEVYYC